MGAFSLFAKAMERRGYLVAVKDMRALCVGDASFGEYPPDPRDALAAAIVKLGPYGGFTED
ncbi:MAG TPA: hypothetical protein VMU59_09455 [Caulobacteraceae bacterium]|nr:hypothetical protein [Caulobacteraceae bacterium]